MRLATVAQSKEIDEISQTSYGLTGELLMESAGAIAAREIEQSYFPELKKGTIGIICGPGNNGGDGLVVARHLHSSGYRHLVVYTLAPSRHRSVLFEQQLRRAQSHGIRIFDLVKNPEGMQGLHSCTLIVDALFGIGLSRPIEGNHLRLVEWVNSLKIPVIAMDCPSGLNCDTGVVRGHVIRADLTITFGLAKPGFFVADGPRCVGRLRILSIGFPYEALRRIATTHFAFTEKLARRYLPRRPDTTNKSDHGHLLVAAGSPGMWGSGLLASASAYRLGCGYVTWASFVSPQENLREIPEVLTDTLTDSHLWEKKWTAVAVGPGLGVNEKTAQFILKLKERKQINVVVDADAIHVCVKYQLFPLPRHWVMTPHAGELARVIEQEVAKINEDRFWASMRGTEVAGCHVLLKGFKSVLAHESRCMIINSGNSALAKAGTGDVLTGMIGSLLAQGLETLPATATAAYIHGRMADEWVKTGHDRRTFMASDLKDHLPHLMAQMASGTPFI